VRDRCYHIEHLENGAVATTTVVASDGTVAVQGIPDLIRIKMSHWADEPAPGAKPKPASTRSKSRGTRS
jgi:hypothetical protein